MWLDRAAELDRERIAKTVLRVPRGHADPAFADAVFLHVGLLDALEADANAAFQEVGVVIGAGGVRGQAVGRALGHRKKLRRGGRRRALLGYNHSRIGEAGQRMFRRSATGSPSKNMRQPKTR